MHRAKVIREYSAFIPGILTAVRILPMESEGLKTGDFPLFRLPSKLSLTAVSDIRPLHSCELNIQHVSRRG